jgi:hypothetical protein
MLVYRVENKYLKGPYTSYSNRHFSQTELFNFCGERHPNPFNDEGICDFWCGNSRRLSFYFGFKSIEDLKDWFFMDEAIDALYKDDFHVIVYNLDKRRVIFGSKQVIFEKEKATIVGGFDLRFI